MLIVGLGNPGDRYKKTRHNAGFLFIDEMAKQNGLTLSYEAKFKAEVARMMLNGVKVNLIKPQTFMNNSGLSVASYAKYYDVPIEKILVVHDELDLPVGMAKLKKAGGHGGHNGLRDIISHLSSKDFYRLRLGIGHPGDSRQVSDYVLSQPGKGEQAEIFDSIEQSLLVMDDVCKGDYDRAMRCLHSA